ncbi:DUF3164 family protein [Bartonella vinsonii]|uniref:Sulfate transporter n=2 Tax=Bartonella vinsonii TaxID=33047 RepID=N6VIW6_BARVB|nr:DUF3164 family protein [Bartonella vinsonii]ENN93151.1 hypothetical protein BVtw_15430 [Bartonella vinsonii subsp. berkhoffii str. Tweed]ENN94067.1 hypothetical protein BVtw_14200 [Bartonella vinsonii subsp. berkhoffii str. Tweed]ENN94796.1 hypothetical protein BVtw_08210 [Bartonella vinsonii subsp. berkhoffii str. Tweed]ENN95512.1 hypothetical protein BVtw_00500 [Bartonella vinsonii subsp. berkhoffii str. Tweed]
MNKPIELKETYYRKDAKGALVAVDMICPADLLEDEMVHKIMSFAKDLSAQISHFKNDPFTDLSDVDHLDDETVRKILTLGTELSSKIAHFNCHTIGDLSDFDAMLAQKHSAWWRGKKGNCTYTSFDGLQRIKVQVQESFDFGPQLQIAKSLLDECLNEWSADARPEIRAIITRAFNTDKEGKVNRGEIFMLLRLDIDDPRWNEAMRAIREAIRVTTSKEYVRFYERDTLEHPWRPVIIDVAKT